MNDREDTFTGDILSNRRPDSGIMQHSSFIQLYALLVLVTGNWYIFGMIVVEAGSANHLVWKIASDVDYGFGCKEDVRIRCKICQTC